MKKTLFGAALMTMAGAASAQSSFTIVRPYDGARVRENVHVMVPKNSVPSGGYIGVFLDGKMLDAVQPRLDKSKAYYEYVLDTKGRGIKDGSKKLELKLFVDYGGQPRIVDTSSVDITVANSSGIRVPSGGVQLRYNWVPGTEHEYTLVQRVVQSATENNVVGNRAASAEQEGEGIRLLYAVDNAYGNGDGLLRLQVVPNRGYLNKEYAYLTVTGSDGPQRFYPKEMAPIYMRVNAQGREIFGAIPYFPGNEDGTVRGSGSTAQEFLFAAFPLPVLPAKSVRVGSRWEVPLQEGAIDLSNLYTQNSVVQKFKARGEVLGFEWEMGHPCVKIKNSIAAGTGAMKPKNQNSTSGGDTISDLKIGLEETVYFALDTRQVIKIFREQIVEGKIATSGGFSGDGGGGGGGGSRPGGGGGKIRPGSAGLGITGQNAPPAPGAAPGAPGGQRPGGQRPGSRGGAPGGAFGPGGQGGAPSAPQATFFRQRIQRIFTLVK